MKTIIFSLIMLGSSYSMACSVTPMGYYNWTVGAVMTALAEESTASFFEIVSITNTNSGSEYAVVLKKDNQTEVRVYSVTEGPYEPGEVVCGKWIAALVN